jgi:hypothetical protein
LFRHLKAAFFAAPYLSGIGRLPVNLIALVGLAILGFGHPGFWLLALGAETAYLYALASSPRFQSFNDAESLQETQTAVESRRHAITGKLAPEALLRMAKLDEKCARILQLCADSQADDFTVDSDQEALKKLSSLYLKLLLAAQNLTDHDQEAVENQIAAQIASVNKDLLDSKLSPALHESKTATLRILAQRLANFERRDLALEEIASDLLRIEVQIDLALENTGIRGTSESFNIGLVSQLLADNALYGASGASIAEFERTFSPRPDAPQTHRQMESS